MGSSIQRGVASSLRQPKATSSVIEGTSRTIEAARSTDVVYPGENGGYWQAFTIDCPAGPNTLPAAHCGGRPPACPPTRTPRGVRLHRRWGRRGAHAGREPRGDRGRGVRTADGGHRRRSRPRPNDNRTRHARVDAVAREPGGVHPNDGPRGRRRRGTCRARGGDGAGARAAGAAGTIFTLSSMSGHTIEEGAAAASGAIWFQLYFLGGRSG